MYPVDHPILDTIVKAIPSNCQPTRMSECIEFYDPELDHSYEIVVRRIDDCLG